MVHHHNGHSLSAGAESELSDLKAPGRLHSSPQGDFYHKGIQFCSKSEAALASLMERYIQGFVTTPGENFQVPIGNGRHVDFKVGDVLIEYHPIRPLHEMRDRKEYREWRTALRNLREEDKEQFRRETHDYLVDRYTQKRRRAIDQSAEYQGRELIVATTPSEFLALVIRRFGTYPGSSNRFRSEFFELIDEVKTANRGGRFSHSRRKAA